MDKRLAQLSHATNTILASQDERSDTEQDRELLAKLERENADWLYDAKGNTTDEGKAIRHYTEKATRLGINSMQDRWEYACDMVERELLRQVVERNSKYADREKREGPSRNASPPLP